MDHVIFTSDPRYSNVSGIVWQERDHSYLNVSAENFVDLDKMIVSFVLAVPKNDHDKNFENVAMKSTLNSCKINEGVFGNFIIKMAMDDFDETADFKFSCPFRKVKMKIYFYR